MQTPFIQALVHTGFPSHNVSSFYGESFRSAVALPVKDWGFIFRPLFWGYAFLPPAWAFSFYFAAAAGLTVVGWVVLLRRIGVSYLSAVVASLVIFFAPFTQAWWTGIAPLCALFPWILVVFTFRARLRYLALPCAWLTGSWVVSAGYLPGLVVLGFVGAAFLAAFVVRREDLGRLIFLALASLVGGAIGLVYLAPVVRVLAQTVYPGHRIVHGGELPLSQWFSQFTPFGVTVGYDSLLPKSLPESVALGSWLPMLALVLVDYRRVFNGEARSAMRPVVVLGAAFMLLSGWQLVGRFHLLGSGFLWNRSVEQRSLLASGLLLVLVSVWVISEFPTTVNRVRIALFVGLAVLGTGVAAAAVLYGAADLHVFLDNSRDNLLVLSASGLLALGVMFKRDRRLWANPAGVMALMVALPPAAAWAFYNPVQDSRRIFAPIASDVTRALDRDAAARPDGAIAANFPGAMLNGLGYRSVIHALPLPQLDDFARMFPELGPDRLDAIFNRYVELKLFDGTEPELTGLGIVALPRSTVRRFATVSNVTFHVPE